MTGERETQFTTPLGKLRHAEQPRAVCLTVFCDDEPSSGAPETWPEQLRSYASRLLNFNSFSHRPPEAGSDPVRQHRSRLVMRRGHLQTAPTSTFTETPRFGTAGCWSALQSETLHHLFHSTGLTEGFPKALPGQVLHCSSCREESGWAFTEEGSADGARGGPAESTVTGAGVSSRREPAGGPGPTRRGRGRCGLSGTRAGAAQSQELLRRATPWRRPPGMCFIGERRESQDYDFQGNEFQVIWCHSSPRALSLSREC